MRSEYEIKIKGHHNSCELFPRTSNVERKAIHWNILVFLWIPQFYIKKNTKSKTILTCATLNKSKIIFVILQDT